jgi:hypothetical protein
MFFLGAITGSSGAYSNQQTGASGVGTFAIPPGTQSLYLMPSASGISFEFGVATGPTAGTFQTTPNRAAQLEGPNLLSGPFRCPRTVGPECVVVSIVSQSAGFVSMRVYASPTS